MRDNRPMQLEAEDYVCSRLAKINLRYSKPNFDESGGDIIVINQITEDNFKSIKVQVKGRNITNNNSNIVIYKNYVTDNFIFFLYLRIDNDFNDYLYCFFDNDITKWESKDDKYYLNIPQNSIESNRFNANLFTQEKVKKIFEIIEKQEEKYNIENTEWNLTLLENNIRLWQTTECLPDPKLTKWFLENTNPDYALISHNVFLTCLAIIYSEELETISAVDYMFLYLKYYEIQNDASISNIKVVKTFTNIWLITYTKSRVELLLLEYNGILHNALRLVFGDNEEQIESILIDNGDLWLNYNEKK